MSDGPMSYIRDPWGMLTPGRLVEVRDRFIGAFRPGFEVVGLTEDGYVVKRVSDGRVLPARLPAHDLRPHLAASGAGREVGEPPGGP